MEGVRARYGMAPAWCILLESGEPSAAYAFLHGFSRAQAVYRVLDDEGAREEIGGHLAVRLLIGFR